MCRRKSRRTCSRTASIKFDDTHQSEAFAHIYDTLITTYQYISFKHMWILLDFILLIDFGVGASGMSFVTQSHRLGSTLLLRWMLAPLGAGSARRFRPPRSGFGGAAAVQGNS